MSRRFLPALWAFTLLFLMMQVSAQAATYVVAPFKVSGAQGYSYLGQAVPSMLRGWSAPLRIIPFWSLPCSTAAIPPKPCAISS